MRHMYRPTAAYWADGVVMTCCKSTDRSRRPLRDYDKLAGFLNGMFTPNWLGADFGAIKHFTLFKWLKWGRSTPVWIWFCYGAKVHRVHTIRNALCRVVKLPRISAWWTVKRVAGNVRWIGRRWNTLLQLSNGMTQLLTRCWRWHACQHEGDIKWHLTFGTIAFNIKFIS